VETESPSLLLLVSLRVSALGLFDPVFPSFGMAIRTVSVGTATESIPSRELCLTQRCEG